MEGNEEADRDKGRKKGDRVKRNKKRKKSGGIRISHEWILS